MQAAPQWRQWWRNRDRVILGALPLFLLDRPVCDVYAFALCTVCLVYSVCTVYTVCTDGNVVLCLLCCVFVGLQFSWSAVFWSAVFILVAILPLRMVQVWLGHCLRRVCGARFHG